MDSSDRGGSLFRIALITHALANLIGFAGIDPANKAESFQR